MRRCAACRAHLCALSVSFKSMCAGSAGDGCCGPFSRGCVLLPLWVVSCPLSASRRCSNPDREHPGLAGARGMSSHGHNGPCYVRRSAPAYDRADHAHLLTAVCARPAPGVQLCHNATFGVVLVNVDSDIERAMVLCI